MKLSERINFDLAKLLNNRLYTDLTDDKYADGKVVVTWDNYLGSKEYQDGEYIDDGEYFHGNYFYAPTYGEVIDWLFDKGIIIDFDPCFTYSIIDRIAYYYKVYKIKEDKLIEIFNDVSWISSFKLAMYDIVKKLIEEKYID